MKRISFKDTIYINSNAMLRECNGCVRECINHADHELPGGCLEGLQLIVYPKEIRSKSPPLYGICVRTELYANTTITIEIPVVVKKEVPCAMCLEYNIRDIETGLFRTALQNTIECEDHTNFLEYGYIPSVFTLYKNSAVHTPSTPIEFTCGCNACIRNALQYYCDFISKGKNISSTIETCGFR